MPIFKAEFYDFDMYRQSTANWDIDFRLLSKNNFYAYLNMYISNTIQLTRTRLNGKVDQYGLCPAGYRSIVVPVCKNGYFNWLNKKVNKNHLLIFPKNRTLDAISFDAFDVFVVDINETFLEQLIYELKLDKALKLFKAEEQFLPLDQVFAKSFHQLAENFLQQAMIQQSRNAISNDLHFDLVDHVIIPLLKYINGERQIKFHSPERKRDKALKDVVDIINANTKNVPSINDLCQMAGISERTLQYAFLEKYQISPSEFIKASKLHKVKFELSNSEDRNIKISTIVKKYGFWHMGQFAADFKNQFGILPSKILRKKFN